MSSTAAPPLKLTVEMVPSSTWYNNMRKVVSQETWDTIRRSVYREYGYRCGICGTKGRMNCHERWDYNDATHVQTLLGFVALCDLCHWVKHFGLAQISPDRVRIDDVVGHFMRVNTCDKATCDRHLDEYTKVWQERSKHEWMVDLGQYVSMADEPQQVPVPSAHEWRGVGG
jgi:hypothetical protein